MIFQNSGNPGRKQDHRVKNQLLHRKTGKKDKKKRYKKKVIFQNSGNPGRKQDHRVKNVFFLDSRNFGKSPFFCLFFLFSDVKVDFSHGGPVFLLDSRNFGKSPFFNFFLSFFPVFRCKSWFFTRWSCFLAGFPEFWKITFFLTFFFLFFLFSEVKVDFSHGGPVFFLDSRNFGKSPVFFTFFLSFFPVFRCKSWFFTRWSWFLPGFLESMFFFFFFLFFFCFYYVYFLFFLNWYFQTFHMKDSFNDKADDRVGSRQQQWQVQVSLLYNRCLFSGILRSWKQFSFWSPLVFASRTIQKTATHLDM